MGNDSSSSNCSKRATTDSETDYSETPFAKRRHEAPIGKNSGMFVNVNLRCSIGDLVDKSLSLLVTRIDGYSSCGSFRTAQRMIMDESYDICSLLYDQMTEQQLITFKSLETKRKDRICDRRMITISNMEEKDDMVTMVLHHTIGEQSISIEYEDATACIEELKGNSDEQHSIIYKHSTSPNQNSTRLLLNRRQSREFGNFCRTLNRCLFFQQLQEDDSSVVHPVSGEIGYLPVSLPPFFEMIEMEDKIARESSIRNVFTAKPSMAHWYFEAVSQKCDIYMAHLFFSWPYDRLDLLSTFEICWNEYGSQIYSDTSKIASIALDVSNMNDVDALSDEILKHNSYFQIVWRTWKLDPENVQYMVMTPSLVRLFVNNYVEQKAERDEKLRREDLEELETSSIGSIGFFRWRLNRTTLQIELEDKKKMGEYINRLTSAAISKPECLHSPYLIKQVLVTLFSYVDVYGSSHLLDDILQCHHLASIFQVDYSSFGLEFAKALLVSGLLNQRFGSLEDLVSDFGRIPNHVYGCFCAAYLETNGGLQPAFQTQRPESYEKLVKEFIFLFNFDATKKSIFHSSYLYYHVLLQHLPDKKTDVSSPSESDIIAPII